MMGRIRPDPGTGCLLKTPGRPRPPLNATPEVQGDKTSFVQWVRALVSSSSGVTSGFSAASRGEPEGNIKPSAQCPWHPGHPPGSCLVADSFSDGGRSFAVRISELYTFFSEPIIHFPHENNVVF